MVTIAFWGASDDLVYVEMGDSIEKFSVMSDEPRSMYAGSWRLKTAANGASAVVHAIYDGCWSFAVGIDDPEATDAAEYPGWPIRVQQSAENEYTMQLEVDCPHDTTVTLIADGRPCPTVGPLAEREVLQAERDSALEALEGALTDLARANDAWAAIRDEREMLVRDSEIVRSALKDSIDREIDGKQQVAMLLRRVAELEEFGGYVRLSTGGLVSRAGHIETLEGLLRLARKHVERDGEAGLLRAIDTALAPAPQEGGSE